MITNTVKTGIAAATTLALTLAFGYASTAVAQSKGAGAIVCWKDASGKVIGCGDKVPPEYANSGTRELDKGGNVRKTGESADEAAKRRVREKEQAEAKAEEQKRVAEQKRQDSALVNTFSNEKEIDLKRDRELQALDNNITQQRGALKVANERLTDAQQRATAFEKTNKDKKPAPQGVKDDLARAEGDKGRLEQDIAAKEKEKQDTMAKYAAYKTRYMEIKGITPAAAPAAPGATAPGATAPGATAPAPAATATAPAAAKK
jgi:ADP-ribose pyrophosphatase YjhB (NUDIX family)